MPVSQDTHLSFVRLRLNTNLNSVICRRQCDNALRRWRAGEMSISIGRFEIQMMSNARCPVFKGKSNGLMNTRSGPAGHTFNGKVTTRR